MPGLTQSAARAARRIVRACRWGEEQVTLALPGKLIALAHGVAPSAVGRSYNAFTRRFIQPLIRRAGKDLNQKSG